MTGEGPGGEAAEVVLPCEDLDEAIAFLTGRLGLRLDAIFPADAPRVARLSGSGGRVRLEKVVGAGAGVGADAGVGAGAGAGAGAGVGVGVGVGVGAGAGAAWVLGRAGMRYRDLVPDRQGGRLIASHIQLREGGAVADYVHFHEVRFQMIYCKAGWIRVVYEDQGPPFLLEAGDCVLQPPRIRHRVLESSAGAEVVEVGSPAEHETLVEHAMALPTATVNPGRDFSGQRFVRHVASSAAWRAWQPQQPRGLPRARLAGFEARDTGIGEATRGLAEVHVLRARGPLDPAAAHHEGALLFWFVLGGAAVLQDVGAGRRLAEGDACVVPPGTEHAWSDASGDLELLRVALFPEAPAA